MLALARCVMALGLPVRLRLLIPAVENSIGGDGLPPRRRAHHAQRHHGRDHQHRRRGPADPGRRAGRGRRASEPAPPARRGDAHRCRAGRGRARSCRRCSRPTTRWPRTCCARAGEPFDPLWRLPLHAPYLGYMKSPVADLANAGSKPFAGAITAALFLKEFVKQTTGLGASRHVRLERRRPPRPAARRRGHRPCAPLLALIEARFGAGRAADAPCPALAAAPAARDYRLLHARSRPAGWTTTSTAT